MGGRDADPILIAAVCTANRGIGLQGALPWRCREDLQQFRALTLGAALIMGRHTYESLPGSMPHRTLIVLSASRSDSHGDTHFCRSFEDALALARELGKAVFIAGGASVYAQALQHASVTRMRISWMQGDWPCDTVFPQVSSRWRSRSRCHEAAAQVPFVVEWFDAFPLLSASP